MDTIAPNVDHNEINKFEALAARWWDPDSEFKTLHDINPLRLHYIERTVSLAEKTVVDVGCGGGILSEAMAAQGASVTGIDMGEMPLRVADLHTLESGLTINYQRLAAEELAQEMPAHFDVVTCMELLEHVPNPASTIKACAQLVKPGGWVFFSTLNRNLKAYLFAIVGAEQILGLLPKGTHDFQRFIRPEELARWARQAALRITDVTGLVYNPLLQTYHLKADNIDVNYLMTCRRLYDSDI
jgi:2-polyprenyl-6-hydroxyphenyl methylase/3-demethylubiquinone-9 3-methyltransferase